MSEAFQAFDRFSMKSDRAAKNYNRLVISGGKRRRWKYWYSESDRYMELAYKHGNLPPMMLGDIF